MCEVNHGGDDTLKSGFASKMPESRQVMQALLLTNRRTQSGEELQKNGSTMLTTLEKVVQGITNSDSTESCLDNIKNVASTCVRIVQQLNGGSQNKKMGLHHSQPGDQEYNDGRHSKLLKQMHTIMHSEIFGNFKTHFEQQCESHGVRYNDVIILLRQRNKILDDILCLYVDLMNGNVDVSTPGDVINNMRSFILHVDKISPNTPTQKPIDLLKQTKNDAQKVAYLLEAWSLLNESSKNTNTFASIIQVCDLSDRFIKTLLGVLGEECQDNHKSLSSENHTEKESNSLLDE